MSENFDLLKSTGLECFENGKYLEAIKALTAAREINGDDFKILYYLGGSAYLAADFELAKDALECATEKSPENADAFFDLGLVLEKCGAPEDAEIAFTQAITNDASHIDALHHLGIIQLTNGKANLATETLKDASRRRTDDAKIHFDLARAYIAAGDRKLALRERQIIELSDRTLGEMIANMIAIMPNLAATQNLNSASTQDNLQSNTSENISENKTYNPF